MTTDKDDQLVRWYDGKLSQEETDALVSWMHEAPENREHARQIYDICFAARIRAGEGRFDTDAALRKVHGEMSVRRSRKVLTVLRNIAAALLLPVVLAASFFFLRRTAGSGEDIPMIEVSTVTGMISRFELPDGSQVWLNANTTLRYPAVFGKTTRDVELDGEAFFDVAKDRQHPFSVHTAKMDIRVTGTRFNVDAYDLPGRNPRAWLEEGGIELRWTDGTGTARTAAVVPDQCAELDLDTRAVDISSMEAEGALAWTRGGFSFQDTPLEEALRQIGNRFHVRFILKNRALAEKRYTGDLTDDNLPTLLQNFTLADGIRFSALEKSDADDRRIMEVY